MPDDPSASTSATDSFEQRTRFGSFEILRTDDGKQLLLGKGAFGRTYKARHVFLERTVALKIINDKFLSDAKARERFLGEARAAAKLSHPHIAQILDFGETDGILYYAMEYCSGGDLSDYVKRNGPLSVVQTVQIGLQVAGALQCAHGAGFIHRDLKPSNLMLASPDGPIVTKLIDFGLVLAAPTEDSEPIDPDDMPTIEQRFIGTPLFASPEQLLVQPLDARSDFFALGMTLWFLILGAAPDQGNSAAIVASRLKADSYATRLPRKLPQTFQAVLARLLEKQPANRFANSTQLVAAFGKCAAGLGLPTAPSSTFAAGMATSEEDAGPPQPVPIEQIDAPVEECYTVQGHRGGNATGMDYEATALSDQSTVWLHFLKPVILEQAKMLERLRKHVGLLQRRPQPSVLQPSAMRAHTDRTVVVLEAPSGIDLLAASKNAGPIRLAEARPLLQAIATGCDLLLAAGLPAPELEPHRIFIKEPAYPAPTAAASFTVAEPRLIPQLLTRNEVAAVEGIAPVLDEPVCQFAMVVYRVLSARNLPAKPVLTPQDCLAIAGLSEEANRLLSHAIARQLVHATCSELLADLLISEGLMGASITRTHGTSSPASTQGTSTGTLVPAPPRSSSEDSQLTSTPAPPPLPVRPSPPTTTGLAATLPPLDPNYAPPVPARERSAWPIIIGAIVLLLAMFGGGAWMLFAPRNHGGGQSPSVPGNSQKVAFPKASVVQLLGFLPDHAKARVDGREAALEKVGDGWRVTFDGTAVFPPVTLTVDAKGFATANVEIADTADLNRPFEISMKRSTGTLVFKNREGADYDHVVLKMIAQLPDEQSFVELERFPRGVTEVQNEVPTGIYQLTLKGANERVVRPRVFNRVVIQAGQTVDFEMPPPLAGSYAGQMSPQGRGASDAAPYRIDLTLDPGLETGTYTEPGKRGTRRLDFSEGRVDAEGTYTARILFSAASDGEQSFDQILSLKREEDGSFSCEVSELPDENTILEKRLGRQPYPKATFFARGTLRAEPRNP
jgi:tRNA A-37 threonylcarbamoyl transferase component Bud32